MRIKIEFELEMPDITNSDADLEEYLLFEFGGKSQMEKNVFYSIVTPRPLSQTFKWRKV